MRVALQQQRNPHPNAPRTFLPLAPRTPAAPARRHSRRRQPRCAPSGLGKAAGLRGAGQPYKQRPPCISAGRPRNGPVGAAAPPASPQVPGAAPQRAPQRSPASETMPSHSQRGSVQTLFISGAAGGSVRCGAPRARAVLPALPSCGDARRRAGREHRDRFLFLGPPAALRRTPRGVGRVRGGAGRGGTGRAAGRRGGLHLRLRAEAGDGGCRHLHELTSHPLQRIAPRVSPSHGGAHLARGRARLLSPCLSVRSLEAHTCARAVLHPPRTHLCAHTHSCSFRDYGPPSCRPSTRTGSSCAALSTHTHP